MAVFFFLLRFLFFFAPAAAGDGVAGVGEVAGVGLMVVGLVAVAGEPDGFSMPRSGFLSGLLIGTWPMTCVSVNSKYGTKRWLVLGIVVGVVWEWVHYP